MLLGHPAGLYICFLTELWERFSYYGMRALLVFYLTQHLLFDDSSSLAVYGAYTSLAWGLPIIGGILADRYLGARKAVTIGAILLSAGHLLLAWEGPPAKIAADGSVLRSDFHYQLFLFSLALIVTGVGFLKTNISTIVGALYADKDPRRDSGFTIFYLGINLGAFIGPILCGWIGSSWGWGYGFSIAGLGMLAGLIQFLLLQRFLEGHAEPPRPDWLRQKFAGFIRNEFLLWGAALALVVLAWALIRWLLVGAVLGWFGAAVGAAIVYFALRHCSPVERDRLIVVGLLIAFSIFFWSLYEQMGSSLNLFSDRMVNRDVGGTEIPAQTLQSLPALFVISLAPLFTMLWSWLGRRRANPNMAAKFALALILIGVGYWLPVIGAAVAPEGERIGLIWFAGLFLMMVCGELCMAPIGMNMITRLCPRRVVGMMMGSFFLALSLGSYFAGRLATLAAVKTDADGNVIDFAAAIDTYSRAFTWFAIGGIAVGIVLFLLSPLLYRRMHDED